MLFRAMNFSNASRLFGFLTGAVVAGASVYYYVLGDYRVSNEMLNDDITVCFEYLSLWLNIMLAVANCATFVLSGIPGGMVVVHAGSSTCHHQAPVIYHRARVPGGSTEEEIGSFFSIRF